MRTRIFVLSIVLSLLCTVFLAGCNQAAPNRFGLYAYDTEANSFVDVGCSLSFDEERSQFTITYLDSVQLFGEMSQTAMGYTLDLDSNVFLQATQALNALTDEQKDSLTAETFASWKDAITMREQLFFYGRHAFTASSIDLIRRVEGDGKNNYSAIDGYYESAANAENIYLFKNGKVYGNVTDKDGKATYKGGEPVMSETANAAYVLNNGFIVLTRIDKNGEPLLDAANKPRQIVYLFAGITYPQDIADFIYTEDSYSESIKTLASQLAGKTLGVLTKTFYSAEDLSALDFN